MNMLLLEILACLFAAAFLSLLVGWAIRSVLAGKELSSANAAWETKHSELELRYKQDTEHFESQVTRLEQESTQLKAQNENLNESLRENEIGVHKARADAIELNRQQADTQERLQRIIAQKDDELKMFREGAGPAISATALGASPAMDDGTTQAKIATLSAKREAWERERQRLIDNGGEDQATVAIDPGDIPAERLDSTVRVKPEYVDELRSKSPRPGDHDLESDKTMTIDDDQTIALDDHNLNRSNPGGNPDNKRRPGDKED